MTAHTVLVVDDDASVRAVMARALQENGYTVLQAGQGEEALKVCEKHLGPIDVVVTDVLLPNKTVMAIGTNKQPAINGIAVMRKVQEQRPETKVILISGQSDDLITALRVQKQGVSFLRKPFNPQTLTRAVRDALGATA